MTKIEVQYFTGCPNSQRMIDVVKSAIDQIDRPVDYIETLVETDVAARKVKFRGSPTLLINGIDFENLPVPEIPGLACRYYQNGLPTEEEIILKVNETRN